MSQNTKIIGVVTAEGSIEHVVFVSTAEQAKLYTSAFQDGAGCYGSGSTGCYFEGDVTGSIAEQDEGGFWDDGEREAVFARLASERAELDLANKPKLQPNKWGLPTKLEDDRTVVDGDALEYGRFKVQYTLDDNGCRQRYEEELADCDLDREPVDGLDGLLARRKLEGITVTAKIMRVPDDDRAPFEDEANG